MVRNKINVLLSVLSLLTSLSLNKIYRMSLSFQPQLRGKMWCVKEFEMGEKSTGDVTLVHGVEQQNS